MNNLEDKIDILNERLNIIEECCNREECVNIAMLIDKENEACQLAEVSNRIRIPSEI